MCAPSSSPWRTCGHEEGQPLDEVRRPQMRFRLKLPRSVPPLSLLRRQADLTP